MIGSDWTDAREHDPGITMVQLLAYTAAALTAVVVVHRWRSRREASCARGS